MTTKELLRKQVIILMNNNKSQFMKDSSVHIANINRALKNIKLEVIIDFVQLEQSDIVINY